MDISEFKREGNIWLGLVIFASRPIRLQDFFNDQYPWKESIHTLDFFMEVGIKGK